MNKEITSIKKLEKLFLKETDLIYPLLLESMGIENANRVTSESVNQYRILVPRIPFIGGKKNPMDKDLQESVRLLAFYKSMKNCGFSPDITYRIVYRAFELKLGKYPKFILKLAGKLQLSSLFKMKLKKIAQKSAQKAYSGDFVFNVVDGDGKDFDWGIEFKECAILKFFRSQNAEEFMPFICSNDYVTSRFFGLGLSRTMTLAEGLPKCDQYLKRGRETAVKHPPGIVI